MQVHRSVVVTLRLLIHRDVDNAVKRTGGGGGPLDPLLASLHNSSCKTRNSFLLFSQPASNYRLHHIVSDLVAQ